MAKRLSEADPETQAAAGIGHNQELDQDTFERHVSAILRHRNGPLALAQAALKSAKKEEKRLKALAKTDGVKLVPFEAYLTLRQMEDEAAASETAIAYTQYFKWGELSEGEQGDLFNGASPTPREESEKWFDRGFKDIRYGATDPEGFFNEKTKTREPGPIMPNTVPSYVPADQYQSWLAGAAEANELNNKDFIEKSQKNAGTPIEDASSETETEDA